MPNFRHSIKQLLFVRIRPIDLSKTCSYWRVKTRKRWFSLFSQPQLIYYNSLTAETNVLVLYVLGASPSKIPPATPLRRESIGITKRLDQAEVEVGSRWDNALLATLSRHNTLSAQRCLGTTLYRHNTLSAQHCLGTTLSRHNTLSAQHSLGTTL